jgi:hypothetical protein
MHALQKKAWCDEDVMVHWIKDSWNPIIKEETMLVIDVHRAQTTDNINALLKDCKTTPVHVPPGTTSLVQPVDVVFNAPFKKRVENCAMQHVHDNLDDYINGKFTASERRVLLTAWIGQAWEELSANEEMIERSFKKCGISIAADGSEDADINIEGLEDYSFLSDSAEEFIGDTDSDCANPFDIPDPFNSDSEEEED